MNTIGNNLRDLNNKRNIKKILTLILIFFFIKNYSFSQDQHLIDSLESQLKNHYSKKLELNIKSPSLYDTTAANILFDLTSAYRNSNPDKAQEYAEECLAVSEQIGFKKGIGRAFNTMGINEGRKGDYLNALEFYNKAL